jgi:hypothetical protein
MRPSVGPLHYDEDRIDVKSRKVYSESCLVLVSSLQAKIGRFV